MYKKTRVRRILEYLRDGLSVREIARILHVSRNTILRIQMSAKQSYRSLEELLELEDDVLYEMFFPEKFDQSPVYADINYSYVHNELKKTGVTLKLLWEEYCEKCRKESVLPCSYSSFTRGYKSYTTSKSYTSAIKHRPGEAIEVDWAGPTMKYRSRDTGKDIPVHLFVATLPYRKKQMQSLFKSQSGSFSSILALRTMIYRHQWFSICLRIEKNHFWRQTKGLKLLSVVFMLFSGSIEPCLWFFGRIYPYKDHRAICAGGSFTSYTVKRTIALTFHGGWNPRAG